MKRTQRTQQKLQKHESVHASQLQNYIVAATNDYRQSHLQRRLTNINGCLHETKLIDEHEITKLYKRLHQLEDENRRLKIEVLRLTNELQKRG